MPLFRFLVEPRSPWQTPLRSDMLNGLILYRIAEDEGDDAVAKAIARFRQGEAPFACSSAFPHGYLPMPKLAPIPRNAFAGQAQNGRCATGPVESLKLAKRFRKRRFIPMSSWLLHKDELSLDSLFADYAKGRIGDEKDVDGMSGVEPHVTIDRATGMAAPGGLFFSRPCYFSGKCVMDLYAETRNPKRLLEILKRIGVLGFGKDASSGRGQFDVELDDGFNAADLAGGPHRMLLSEFSLPRLHAVDGFYALEVRRGRAGPAMGRNPFKAPFLCLTEGSVLKTMPKGVPLLDGLHADPRVVQLVAPVTLACKLKEM